MNRYDFVRNTSTELTNMSKKEPNAIELVFTFNIEEIKISESRREVALHNVVVDSGKLGYSTIQYFYVYGDEKYLELAKISSSHIGKLVDRSFRGTSFDYNDDNNILSMYTVIRIEDKHLISEYREKFMDELRTIRDNMIAQCNNRVKSINAIIWG